MTYLKSIFVFLNIIFFIGCSGEPEIIEDPEDPEVPIILPLNTVSEARIEISNCNSSTTYPIVIDFDYNTEVENFYLSSRHNLTIGEFKFSDLPITIDDFQVSDYANDYVRVCIDGIAESCVETVWEAPHCRVVCEQSNSNCRPDYFRKNSKERFKIAYNGSKVKSYTWYGNEYQYLHNQYSRVVSFDYNSQNEIIRAAIDADGSLSSASTYHYVDGRLDSITTSIVGGFKNRFLVNWSEEEDCGPIETKLYFQYSNADPWELDRSEDFSYESDCTFETRIIAEKNKDTIIRNYAVEFDDQVNYWPIRSVAFPRSNLSYVYPQKNNVLSVETTNEDGDVFQDYRTYTSVYAYHQNGLVRNEIRTYANAIVDTFTFFYK